MALDPMQGGEMEEPQEAQGTSIELTIQRDGTLSLSVEDGDVEGAESSDMPMESLEQALQSIKQYAEQVLSQQSPEQAQEDAAFKGEMAQGM